MSARRALVAVASAALATLALVVPGPLGEPARRLANTDADVAGPHYDRPLDDRSLRRAGELVPDDATYFVDAAGADPVLQGNVKAATQLYLAPALPVLDRTRAQWIVRLQRDEVIVRRAP